MFAIVPDHLQSRPTLVNL